VRDVIPIHNSDQEAFLSCRRRWDLTSILRQAYRPVDMPRPLKFGICMHQGYEVLHDPRWWLLDLEFVLVMAKSEFVEAMKAVRDQYLMLSGREALDEEHQIEYDECMILGKNMLDVYADYMIQNEDRSNWHPLGVEEEWEVPLGFSVEGVEVVFRFRTDLRMADRDGFQWLWDHKTTARMSESTAFLERDPQMGKYLWGLKKLGYPVIGAIYNEQYKGYPDLPAVLKVTRLGRSLSTSKSQDTTYALMMRAIQEHNEDPAMYEEYLEWLKATDGAKQFVRRTMIRRNEHQLKMQHQTLQDITVEMLNNPTIYPSPTKFKCDFCMVPDVCQQMEDGSDWEWTLKNRYHQVKDHYGHAV